MTPLEASNVVTNLSVGLIKEVGRFISDNVEHIDMEGIHELYATIEGVQIKLRLEISSRANKINTMDTNKE